MLQNATVTAFTVSEILRVIGIKSVVNIKNHSINRYISNHNK